MKSLFFVTAALYLSVAIGQGAINPGGIVNAASFSPQGLPNSKIAQGSIFTIFGSELSDAGVHQQGSFPLANAIGGTSIQVTVNGTTVNAIPLVASPNQVSALLPSSTPVGSGTLTLQAGGQSYMEPIEIAEHSPGLFALNQAGSGPGVFHNYVEGAEGPVVNLLDQAASSGQIVTLWLTGLGAIPGDEAAAPPVQSDLQSSFDLDIYVAGQAVERIDYAGRSLYAGLDQINFQVPQAASGCYAPVAVVVDGVPSNTVTMSIASEGTVCSDADGFEQDELDELLTGDAVSIGYVNLTSIVSSPTLGQQGDIASDGASANFWRYTAQEFRQAGFSSGFTPTGSCFVYSFRGQAGGVPQIVQPMPLDAGVLRLTGPNNLDSEVPLISPGEPGAYYLPLGPQPPTPGAPRSIVPGDYTFSGQGGAHVGAFNVTRSYSGGVTWTNRDQITEVNRAQGLTVTWTGGDEAEEYLYISGNSFRDLDVDSGAGAVGAAFVCQAPVSAGSFTVGPEVLAVLPESQVIETPLGNIQTGSLAVGTISRPERFSAPGLDLGFYLYQSITNSTLSYR